MEIRLSIALKKDREGTDPIQVTSDDTTDTDKVFPKTAFS